MGKTLQQLPVGSQIGESDVLILSQGTQTGDEKQFTAKELRHYAVVKEYDPNLEHVQGQLAAYQGHIYQALTNTKGPWKPSNWLLLTHDTNDTSLASWYNQTSYSKDDLVSYQGGIYRAKQANQGRKPTNTTYWEVLKYVKQNGKYQSGGYYEGQVVYYGNLWLKANSAFVSRDVNSEIDNDKWDIIGGFGIYRTIKKGWNIHVPPYAYYKVDGDLTIEDGATFHIHANAEVVIVDGNIINNGNFTNNGRLIHK